MSAEYVLDGVQPANGPFFGQGNFHNVTHYFKVGMNSSQNFSISLWIFTLIFGGNYSSIRSLFGGSNKTCGFLKTQVLGVGTKIKKTHNSNQKALLFDAYGGRFGLLGLQSTCDPEAFSLKPLASFLTTSTETRGLVKTISM